MTRQRRYYSRRSRKAGEEEGRVMTSGRLEDARTGADPSAAPQRGSLTLPQVAGLLVLALAQFFDWATFQILVLRHGSTAEANPIVRHIFDATGIQGLTLAKVATVEFVAVMIVLIGHRHRRLAYGLFLFGIAAGIVGGLSNIATL
jgi:hypothetical protein